MKNLFYISKYMLIFMHLRLTVSGRNNSTKSFLSLAIISFPFKFIEFTNRILLLMLYFRNQCIDLLIN